MQVIWENNDRMDFEWMTALDLAEALSQQIDIVNQ
jgi:hypothetical protein